MSPIYVPGKVTLKKESVAADPYYNNVSLLLHGDGTNGSTTIVDSSPTPKTALASGNAQISTAQSKFGAGSIFFDNNSANKVSITPTSDFAFQTNDFTVEAWVYQLGQNLYTTLVEIGNHVTSAAGIVFLTGTSGFQVYASGFFGSGGTATLNAWQHVAFCRSGTTLRVFLNGTQSSATTFANNLTDVSQVNIGFAPLGGAAGSLSNYRFNGYIDDLRITKGVARYTANFTPPTAPFPEVLG